MKIKIPGTNISVSFGGKSASKDSQLISPVNQLYSEISALMEAADHPFSEIILDIRSYIKDYENLSKEGKKAIEALNSKLFYSHAKHDDSLFDLKVKFDEYTDRIIKKDNFLEYLNDFSKTVAKEISSHIEVVKNIPEAANAVLSPFGAEVNPELKKDATTTANELKEYAGKLNDIFSKVEQTVNANNKAQAIA